MACALALPEISNGQPLAAVGEERLGASLRAVLRCIERPVAVETNRPPLLAAAQSLLQVFASFALQTAAEQRRLLERSAVLTANRPASGRSDAAHAAAVTSVRTHLENHAAQLRMLVPALRNWVEAALDDETVTDVETRQAVLRPLGEIAAVAAKGIAEADRMAAGLTV